ncbi:SRPBCC domain-containing protein [Cellulomonas humilata]|uniref:SRPBCC domain-containing protein n=1 Tax=Cellulomonas humilata TaxID=144055 RepID=A0A7Y6A024_9CELL|nr:SRPBCC domain-containing protein [Cellulomonas humilata]NUU17180.1 SRPBCC domain-containing protein [Cellulomonas humilata]
MSQDFTTTYTVDQTPAEVFAAVTDVRGWWVDAIEGGTAELGDEFTFHNEPIHRSVQRLTAVVPGERVEWLVLEAELNFVEDTAEWVGTRIRFDITPTDSGTRLTFTHVGLVPAHECYEICHDAWSWYINVSLKRRITTGVGQPGQVPAEALRTPVVLGAVLTDG